MEVPLMCFSSESKFLALSFPKSQVFDKLAFYILKLVNCLSSHSLLLFIFSIWLRDIIFYILNVFALCYVVSTSDLLRFGIHPMNAILAFSPKTISYSYI